MEMTTKDDEFSADLEKLYSNGPCWIRTPTERLAVQDESNSLHSQCFYNAKFMLKYYSLLSYCSFIWRQSGLNRLTETRPYTPGDSTGRNWGVHRYPGQAIRQSYNQIKQLAATITRLRIMGTQSAKANGSLLHSPGDRNHYFVVLADRHTNESMDWPMPG